MSQGMFTLIVVLNFVERLAPQTTLEQVDWSAGQQPQP